MKTGLYSRPWLIVPVCAAMHLTFAIAYLIDAKVGSITALHIAREMFGPLTWVVLFAIGIIALAPLAMEMSAKWVHACLWPQQFMLFLMAISALQAAYLGSYPDGYKASSIFIFTDQCYAIYLMAGHFTALLRNAGYR